MPDIISPSKERAIAALLVSKTITRAAETAGVSSRSIFRWLREDETFRRALRAARRQALALGTARLQQIALEASDSLGDIIHDAKAASASRVSAIRTALEFAYRAAELEDIEERLADIERTLEEQNHTP